MRKVLIIGAGGIGSFLIPLLDKTSLYSITVYDPDKVEKKNLTYQNFEEEDVGKHKVAVMKGRYNLKAAEPYPILTNNQVQKYDLVVCCADNLDVRRVLYRAKVNFLDLRAQGRNCALISHLADPNMYDTVLSGPEGSFSCQGDSWDGKTKGVHFMQVVAAGMGAQWMQRFFAKEDVAPFKVENL
tara:strand:+ start:210 stop:764 length:555 start_codon:yes stop_codon:yes gene_type:complete